MKGVSNTYIPPNGAGTLEDTGCVCAVAATGTVPKALLKIIHTFRTVRIACLTIKYNLHFLHLLSAYKKRKRNAYTQFAMCIIIQ